MVLSMKFSTLFLILSFSQVFAMKQSMIVHKVKAAFSASGGGLKEIAFETVNVGEGKNFACHASDVSFDQPFPDFVRIIPTEYKVFSN